jgi:hypothetical protein
MQISLSEERDELRNEIACGKRIVFCECVFALNLLVTRSLFMRVTNERTRQPEMAEESMR